MFRNKTLASLLFILIFNHPFEEDVKTAVEVLNEHKEIIIHIKNTSTTEGEEALSIVFPELIRWSAMKDFFETSAVELLYVQKGQEAANFSIGYFQMRPSFIEQLENYVSTHKELETFNYVVITNKLEKECRKERLLRMKQFAWQVRYAHVYWLVAQNVFKHRGFKTKKDRVKFLATAYNYGFLRNEKEIEARLNKANFPFGSSYKGQQIAYGELAVEF